MSVMTYCKRDFEGFKQGELLLAGLLEDFMEEVAFEMRLKEWQHLMRNCWGKGIGDGENALGTGTGSCVQRRVTVWLDSVIFLNPGCTLELLGEIFLQI